MDFRLVLGWDIGILGRISTSGADGDQGEHWAQLKISAEHTWDFELDFGRSSS